jgi:hypothetical protein
LTNVPFITQEVRPLFWRSLTSNQLRM